VAGVGFVAGGVDEELVGPDPEAAQIDLGRRPVPQLQVQPGHLDGERRVAGTFGVAGLDRGHERVAGECV
jgi:hypothetical protein